MKKKNRTMLICMVLTMMLLPLDVYAQEEILGEWNLTRMETDGIEYNPADFGMEAVLLVDEDGTLSLDQMGEVTTGTWEETDGGYRIDLEEELNATITEDTLTITSTDEADQSVIEFSRGKAEKTEIAPVVYDVVLEDFDGTWVPEAYYFEDTRMPAQSVSFDDTTITIKDGEVHYISNTVYNMAEDSTADSDTGDNVYTTEYVAQGVLEDGILKVEASDQTGYTELKLQIHEDGTMSDGYDADRQEMASEEETEEEAVFDYYSFVIYVRAE